MDEFAELNEIYSANSKIKTAAASNVITPQSLPAESPAGSVAATSSASEEPSFAAQSSAWSPRSLYSATLITSPPKRRRTNDDGWPSFNPIENSSPFIPLRPRTTSFQGSPDQQLDAIDSLLRAADFSEHAVNQGVSQGAVSSSPSHGGLHDHGQAHYDKLGIWPQVNVQEACLMRYFIDELSCWACYTSLLQIVSKLIV